MKLTVIYLKEHGNVVQRRFLCNHPLRFDNHPVTEDLNEELEEMLLYISPMVNVEQIIIVDDEHAQGYNLDDEDIAKITQRLKDGTETMRQSYGAFALPPVVMKHSDQGLVKYTHYNSNLVLVECDEYVTTPTRW